MVLTPKIFLSRLRKRLERSGVSFERKSLSSLAEATSPGQDILVNTSGWGLKFMEDVKDDDVQLVRGQTVHVRSKNLSGYMAVLFRIRGVCGVGSQLKGPTKVYTSVTSVDESIFGWP